VTPVASPISRSDSGLQYVSPLPLLSPSDRLHYPGGDIRAGISLRGLDDATADVIESPGEKIDESDIPMPNTNTDTNTNTTINSNTTNVPTPQNKNDHHDDDQHHHTLKVTIDEPKDNVIEVTSPTNDHHNNNNNSPHKSTKRIDPPPYRHDQSNDHHQHYNPTNNTNRNVTITTNNNKGCTNTNNSSNGIVGSHNAVVLHKDENNVTQPVAVIIDGNISFPHDPVYMVCPYCHVFVCTETDDEPSLLGWLSCATCCLLGGWMGCCLIPLFIPQLQDTKHYCPRCHIYLGLALGIPDCC
jgi:lipopolysaccharide-induced tumor necrosis factor-alpha factor